MPKSLLAALMILLTVPDYGLGDEYPSYNNQPLRFWVSALQSGDAAARANAARVLARFGPSARSAIHALTVTLQDKSIDVRAAAIQALGRMGPDAADAAATLASFVDPRSDRFDVELSKHAAVALANIQPD